MKTIGLIGGMSWESTQYYYHRINEGVRQQLGGLHSATLLLYSVDFSVIAKLQHSGDWDGAASILSNAARSLEAGGADFFLICTNTMHRVADQVAHSVSMPLLHIADATGDLLKANGVSRVGLLGTRFTMEEFFYKQRISELYNIDVVTPNAHDRQAIHDIIYQELCLGVIKPSSKKTYLHIIDRLQQQGVEGVILGCTEIGMLVQQVDTQMALYDTTSIHADRAVAYCLSK